MTQKYTVYITGWIEVEARTKTEATDTARLLLDDQLPDIFDGEQAAFSVKCDDADLIPSCLTVQSLDEVIATNPYGLR